MKKYRLVLKKSLAVIMAAIMITTIMAVIPFVPEVKAAAAGKYDVKIRVWDDDNGCDGGGTLVLKLTHKSNNGTGSVATVEHQLTDDERNVLKSGGSGDDGGSNQVNYVFSDVGFPSVHDATYDIGISYKPDWYFKMYVSPAGTDTWTEVIGKTLIIHSTSVVETKKGTVTTNVPSAKMPYAKSTSISANTTWLSVPMTNDGVSDATFTAGAVLDQYGVRWYQDAALSLTTSHTGVSFSENAVHVTNNANEENNYYLTVKAACSAAVSTMNVLVYAFDYKVTFYDANNQKIGETQTVNYGGSAVPPTPPVMNPDSVGHFTFNEWTGDDYQNLTSGVADRLVKASYTQEAHNFVFDHYIVTPTCTSNGTFLGVCSCGQTKEIAQMTEGHNTQLQAVVAATCDTAGVKAHYECSVCGEKFLDSGATMPCTDNDLIIAPLGHIWTTTSTEPAGCETPGIQHQTCSRCSATKEVETPAIGHSFNVYYTVDRFATCLAPGLKSKHCSRCTATTDAKEIAQISHKIVRYTLGDVAPTCTETGLEAYECSLCHTRFDTVLPDLGGHIWATELTIDTPATCAAPGLQSRHCTRVGCTAKTDVTELTQLSHVMSGWQTVTPATCTVNGLKENVCLNCNYKEQETIPAAHTMVTIAAKEATCTQNGNTAGAYCSVCDYVEQQSITIPATGHSYTEETITPVSCTQNGQKKYTCTVCGDTYTENIISTGHNLVTDEKVDATCTQSGLTEGQHCSVCGTVTVAQTTILALGHNYSDPTCTEPSICSRCGATSGTPIGSHDYIRDEARDVDATCVSNGIEAYSCSRCGETDDKVINAFGHTWVIDAAVAPTCQNEGLTQGEHCSICGEVKTAQVVVPVSEHTLIPIAAVQPGCTTTGLTAGTKCSVCGTVIQAPTVVPALGHDYDSGEVTTPATCTQNGVKTFTCSRCSDSYTEEIAATGHTEVIIPSVAATCTLKGSTEGKKCSVCNQILVEPQAINALGHNYLSEITTLPTCTLQGERTFSCSRCDSVYTETIAANGHTETAIPAVPATCLEAGLTAGVKCTVCNEVLTAPQTVAAFGHNYVPVITLAATCTQNGLKTFTCSRCSDTYTETIVANGHNTVDDAYVAPTCAKTGLTAGSHCSVCNEVFVAQNVIEKLAHTPGSAPTCTSAQICTVCKTVLSPAKGHTVVNDPAVAATCVSKGLTSGSHCSVCGTVIKARTQTPLTDHVDANGDGLCDVCSFDIAAYRQENCSHMCHKTGFMGFLWKIVNFFNKLFKTNKYCSCGAAHY